MNEMTRQAEAFLRDRSLYEEAMMRHVCSQCIDFGEDGICHSQDPEGCAVFRYLPELVAIAQRLNEPKMEPYIHAVRETICVKCRAQSPTGECPLRGKLDCGLDRYLALVFDAIDEVHAERERQLWRTL